MLLTAVIIYILITVSIGAWSSKLVKSSKDFVLAGRQLPLFLSASALFATWFGSETIFGASSEYLDHGLQGVMEDPFGGALCLILFGMFYLRPMYRMNVLTLGDVFKKLFGERIAFLSSLFMVPAYFGYVAAQLVALSLILGAIVSIPLTTGIIISAAIVVFYTFLGGMWAISITDFIQTTMIVVGLLWVATMVATEAGGVMPILESAPEGSFQFFPAPRWDAWVNYLGAWMILGLGSIPSQDIYQRVMSAKSEKVAVRSTYMAGGFYLSFGLLPLFIALGAKVLYPEIYLENKQMLLPEMVLQHGGLTVQVLFFGALLSAIMSTTSSGLLAPAAIISENLIRPTFGKGWKDEHFLWVLRITVIAVAIIAIFMASWKANIYELVADASILLLVSLFIPLTAGLYWKKASRFGAVLAIFMGTGSYLILLTVTLPIYPHVIALFISAAGMLIGTFLRPTKIKTKKYVPESIS
ncbi:sodium:solute symporter family protein [Litoribacter ruber]|uniref:Sodium:solute symporter family protein n=1 Tax=Litoribacter ruber TaxID=702568 RepID=A0AAP2CL38_9BACT|nr:MULTISPECIES: sodium:solute symporter family protein [Litoribacter]MBS9525759.1 sodium:solute symporter family protein [Litoribacter alkaliphilus]MBT0810184.1 sodium:solute symporter family protein [Litoribacter ruber]